MTKYVISTTEIIKKVYIADAYTENEALDRYLDQAPDKVEFIGELVYNIEIINEYEYNKEWKPSQADWVENKNRLKGPALNIISDDSYDLYRDD